MSSSAARGDGRVLLVIGAAAERARLAAAIQAAAFETRLAATGGEAWLAMQAAPADVLVIDLGLPDQPGLQLGQTLRARFGLIPAIFVGDRPTGLTLRLLNELPFARFLPGPPQPDLLVAAIRALHREHQKTGTAPATGG